MKRRATILFLFLLPLLSLRAQQAAPELARLEGIVIDSVTGEPLAGVLVTSRLPGPPTPRSLAPLRVTSRGLEPSNSGEDMMGRPVVQALTDSKGHFSIAAAPGRATVVFGKDNYGVRTLTYALSTEQPFPSATVRLTPTGVISGRVFDAKNNPVSSASVTPLVLRNNLNGRGFGRYPGTRTDDHGEFRLLGLPSNVYILSFSATAGSALYPGVAEFSRMEYVTLESGRESRLKDVVLSGSIKQGTIHVRLTNGPGEKAKDVTYSFANSTPGIDLPGLDGNSFSSVRRGSSSDPVIHFEPNQTWTSSHTQSSVGTYRVTATWKDSNGNSVSASVYADFRGADVDLDLVLQTPDGRLSCRAMVAEAEGTLSPLRNVNVILSSSANTFANCVTGADGSFDVPSIQTGTYNLSFQGIPADAYVLSAKQGDRDALRDGVDVTRDSAALEIRVRRGAGVGRGIVTDREGRNVHDAVVLAIPDSPVAGPLLPRVYPSDRTDQNGGFEIDGLRPGSYRLYAWAVLDDAALQNPEFVKKFEGRGTAITIQERGNISKNLTIVD